MNRQQAMVVKQIAIAMLSAVEAIDDIFNDSENFIDDVAKQSATVRQRFVAIIKMHISDVKEERIKIALDMAIQGERFCPKVILQYLIKDTELDGAVDDFPCDCKTEQNKPNVKTGLREVKLEDVPAPVREMLMHLFGIRKH
jgi:hypothetical protein